MRQKDQMPIQRTEEVIGSQEEELDVCLMSHRIFLGSDKK